jgi:putative hydrolase of the HAD superfamily
MESRLAGLHFNAESLKNWGLLFLARFYSEKMMDQITAIGFDFFNTLITVEPPAMGAAVGRLTSSLEESGFRFDPEVFLKAHKEAAIRLIKETKLNGRETHNRFWISAALNTLGLPILPDDPLISKAVEAYFSAFFDYCHLIPGTIEMLEKLKGAYRLGLLSNFTHAPAARGLLDWMGLTPYFDPILISGAIGFRKPNPHVFELLIEKLGVERERILYVGDDLDPDIIGARQAGLRPIWMTYVRDHHLPVVPGYIKEQAENLDLEVTRISHWEDFLFLLNLTGP